MKHDYRLHLVAFLIIVMIGVSGCKKEQTQQKGPEKGTGTDVVQKEAPKDVQQVAPKEGEQKPVQDVKQVAVQDIVSKEVGVMSAECDKACAKLAECFGKKPDMPPDATDKTKCMAGCEKAKKEDFAKWEADYKKIESNLDKSCEEFEKALLGQPETKPIEEGMSEECTKACTKIAECFSKIPDMPPDATDKTKCMAGCEKEKKEDFAKWEEGYKKIQPFLDKPCEELVKSIMGEQKLPEQPPSDQKVVGSPECDKACSKFVECFASMPDTPDELKDKGKCVTQCDMERQKDTAKWDSDYKTKLEPNLGKSCEEFKKALFESPQ
jgi:hypothetical protein